jgi:hypothetical protein
MVLLLLLVLLMLLMLLWDHQELPVILHNQA